MARHQRADENHLRILQTSAALFAERGYLGTSVNDLVEAAGLTKNAFYSYFPNKEALAVAIVEHTAAQWPPLIATFEALKAVAGVSAPAEHAIQFRQHGVTMQTVREAEKQGFKGLTVEQVLKLHNAGVI